MDQDNEATARNEQLSAELSKLKFELEKKNSDVTAREQQRDAIKNDLAKLQAEQAGALAQAAEIPGKDKEIKRLTDELARAVETSGDAAKLKERLSASDLLLLGAKKDLERLTAETQKLKTELEQKTAETARKDSELQQLIVEKKKLQDDMQLKTTAAVVMENEINALKADVQAKEGASTAEKETLITDLKKLKDELLLKSAVSAVLEQEVQTSKSDLSKANAQLESEGSAVKEEDLQKVTDDLKKMKDDLQIRIFEVTAKDREIKTLKAELDKAKSQPAAANGPSEVSVREYEARIQKLKKSESDIIQLEKTLDEERHALRTMKLRVSEGKMKLQLLSEKTKESVEMIAQFAESKEFEEFRKSIHIDDTIQKYEDEIKDLQIKLMDLEKKH
jgi:chromosome segregation ATPase